MERARNLVPRALSADSYLKWRSSGETPGFGWKHVIKISQILTNFYHVILENKMAAEED